MLVTKKCPRCECMVNVDQFNTEDGMHRYCKMCREAMSFKPECKIFVSLSQGKL